MPLRKLDQNDEHGECRMAAAGRTDSAGCMGPVDMGSVGVAAGRAAAGIGCAGCTVGFGAGRDMVLAIACAVGLDRVTVIGLDIGPVGVEAEVYCTRRATEGRETRHRTSWWRRACMAETDSCC